MSPTVSAYGVAWTVPNGTAGENVLRVTPPLVVTAAEVDQALGVLEEVLA